MFREALHHKPIELRHPFIFYYGHLTAFEKNQIFNYLLKRKSTTEEFDKLFERGIDPYVDDPTICHKHYSSADIENEVWPTRKEIYEYIISTRKMIIENISVVLKQNQEIMAQKGRVFQEVTEHTKMHAETLLYMIQMLDERYKNKLSFETINFNFQKVFFSVLYFFSNTFIFL